MVEVDGNYRIERDHYGWILEKRGLVKNRKTGELSEKWEKHYYGDLYQVTEALLDWECGELHSIAEIQTYLKETAAFLVEKVEDKLEETSNGR